MKGWLYSVVAVMVGSESAFSVYYHWQLRGPGGVRGDLQWPLDGSADRLALAALETPASRGPASGAIVPASWSRAPASPRDLPAPPQAERRPWARHPEAAEVAPTEEELAAAKIAFLVETVPTRGLAVHVLKGAITLRDPADREIELTEGERWVKEAPSGPRDVEEIVILANQP